MCKKLEGDIEREKYLLWKIFILRWAVRSQGVCAIGSEKVCGLLKERERGWV